MNKKDNSITKFSPETKEELKHYVYVYYDPYTEEPFYVGEGQNDRAFDHLKANGDTEKDRKIRSIQRRGKNPQIMIFFFFFEKK